MSLGEFIKHIRIRHGLNQSEFGNLIYRNKDYIYLVENDKTVPTAKEMREISDKLGEPLLMFLYVGFSVNNIIESK